MSAKNRKYAETIVRIGGKNVELEENSKNMTKKRRNERDSARQQVLSDGYTLWERIWTSKKGFLACP